MYIIQRIEHTEVTGEWSFVSSDEAKQQWMKLNESDALYPRLIVDGVPYTIAQAERLFQVGEERKRRFGWGGTV